MVHLWIGTDVRVFGDRLAEPLGQVGMPSGPVVHTIEQKRSDDLLTSEPGLEEGDLLRTEVAKVDTPADVERSQTSVPDEIRGSRNTEQAEGKAIELGVLRTAIVTHTECGKELVGGEGQCAHLVDLVDKDHQSAGIEGGKQMLYRRHPPLNRRRTVRFQPEGLQFRLESQTFAEFHQKAEVPLLRADLLMP